MPRTTLEEYRKKLEAKHWSEAEIKGALKTFAIADKEPDQHARFNQLIYFLALFMSLIGNFSVTIILIPFLILAEPLFLYPGLFIIALSFGGLFDLIVYDIEKISESPRFKQGLFLFGIAVINIWMITSLSSYMSDLVGLVSDPTVAVMIGCVYISGFMIPHIITRSTGLIEKIA